MAPHAMQTFKDNDVGYLEWVQQHPHGFVINTTRSPSPTYLVLHQARCFHITKKTAGHRWTTDYIKVCAEQTNLLEDWVREHIGGTIRRCRTCAP
jgi:hypothetical protein